MTEARPRFDHSGPVPSVDFVCPEFDDLEAVAELADDREPRQAVAWASISMLDAGIAIGAWIGRNQVRRYAAERVLRRATESTANAADRLKVSTSYIRRSIREAQTILSSAIEAREVR